MKTEDYKIRIFLLLVIEKQNCFFRLRILTHELAVIPEKWLGRKEVLTTDKSGGKSQLFPDKDKGLRYS